MYPNEVFFGLTLYDIMLCVGIIACFLLFSLLADKIKLRGRLQNFSVIIGFVAIIFGFFSAMLFQAIYNIAEEGGFVLSENTGVTFYGGLIGGVFVFLLLYFTLGGIVFKGERKGEHIREFFRMSACGAPAITVAHGFGRIGCLFAGCCHGELSQAWCAIPMYGDMGYGSYIPIQLFEAIFLLCLTALLSFLVLKRIYCGLSVYIISYAVWRFAVEFFRGDDRGGINGISLSPSQLTAVIAFVLGLGLLLFMALKEKRKDSADN